MLAVITGATGLVGANLAEALLAAGHRVRATRRATSRLDHVEDLDVDWVEADLHDAEALTRAFDGADAVFHCAAAVTVRDVPPPWVITTNVEGTGNVLRAVRDAGAGRLLYCSSTVTVGISEDGELCDESSPWNLREYGLDDGYATTKYQAELLVRGMAAEGMDVVTVNPGFMFGPRDVRPSSGELIVNVARGTVPGNTPGLNNFVDVRDVCRGMIAAWEKGRAGERYILGHRNMSYRAIFETIAEVAGVRPPSFAVPEWASVVAGWGGDAYQRITDRDAPVNSATIRWAYCKGFKFSSDKARAELGYEPGPIEPAIADAIAWFKARGML